jgi:hypothetical protein
MKVNTCKTKELRKAINTVKPLLGNRSSVLFDGERMITNPMWYPMISTPFQSAFVGWVEAFPLLRSIKGVKSEFVDYHYTTKHPFSQLVLTNGKILGRFNLETENVDITKPDTSEVSWQDLTEDLLSAITTVAPYAGIDNGNAIFHNVFIKDKNVYASDNYQIARYKMKVSFNRELLIPEYIPKIIAKNKFNQIGITSKVLHFRNGLDSILSEERMSGTFLEVKNFFDESNPDLVVEKLSEKLTTVKKRTE